MDMRKNGRVTIPTDLDVVPETLEILKRWGADAIRDCDGTDFPEELRNQNAKIYSTYYTTRKDNAWAKANPDEVQQCYIMSDFHTAVGETLQINLVNGISRELVEVNNTLYSFKFCATYLNPSGNAVFIPAASITTIHVEPNI